MSARGSARHERFRSPSPRDEGIHFKSTRSRAWVHRLVLPFHSVIHARKCYHFFLFDIYVFSSFQIVCKFMKKVSPT